MSDSWTLQIRYTQVPQHDHHHNNCHHHHLHRHQQCHHHHHHTIIIVTTIIIIIDTNLQLRDIGEYQCQVNTEPKISLSVFLLVSGQI